MNAPQRLLSYRTFLLGNWTDAWSQALMWVLLAVAGLLLVGFVSVVEDITQRGEARRAQEHLSTTSALVGDSQIQSKKVARLLSAPGQLLAER